MKKIVLISVMVLIVGALIFGGCGAPTTTTPIPVTPTPTAPAQTTITPAPPKTTAPPPQIPVTPEVSEGKSYELSLNLFIPPIHTRWTGYLKPWTEDIAKASNNRLIIKPYFLGAISAPPEVYDSVVTGLADLGESPSMKIGRVPILDSILNVGVPSIRAKNSTATVWNVYKQSADFQKQMADVKVLFLHAASPLGLCTKEQVAFEDIPNKKMASSSGGLAADRMISLVPGAVVVPTGDIYSALEKGVIDGAASDYELMKARMWGDYLKYYNTGAIAQTAFFCVMNTKKYNSLPDELKKVIDEYSGEYAVELFGRSRFLMDDDNMKWWEENRGGQTVYTTDEQLAYMDEKIGATVDKWIKDQVAKGATYWPGLKTLVDEAQLKDSIPWDLHGVAW